MHMLRNATFWMVWNPEGRAPTYKHTAFDSAVQEAERLARENPGQVFVVLSSVCARVSGDLRIDLQYDEGVPF